MSAGLKAEWNEELQLRLSGKVKDDGIDDQLFGAAATMNESEYR